MIMSGSKSTSITSLLTIFTALAMLSTACGDDVYLPQAAADAEDSVEERSPLPNPSIRLVSPPTWHAGDTIVILGQDFVPNSRGTTLLRLQGSFIDDNNNSRAVDMTVETHYRNGGRVDFEFEAGLPPQGFGASLGRFVGTATATNYERWDDKDYYSEDSQAVDTTVTIGPSLIIWETQPASGRCSKAKLDATLAGESIEIQLEAFGLAATSSYTPLTFRADWVDFAGEAQEVDERVIEGGTSLLTVPMPALPQSDLNGDVLLNISVEDGYGEKLERRLTINLAEEYRVNYDGNIRVVELYEPVLVSSCLPGGSYGTDVSYSSTQGESRSRSVGFSVNVGITAWVVNVGFGMNVSSSVSSSESESLSLSGHILPGQFGVFYRQTQNLERLGQILRRNSCGQDYAAGEARVTDWNWAPDLAVTTDGQCPPAPPSNLPPAQVMQ